MTRRSLRRGAAIAAAALTVGAGMAAMLTAAFAWARANERVPAYALEALGLAAVPVLVAVAAAVALAYATARGLRRRALVVGTVLGSAALGLAAGWLARAVASGAILDASVPGLGRPVLGLLGRGPQLGSVTLDARAWALEAGVLLLAAAALAFRATRAAVCTHCNARCRATLITEAGPAPAATVRAHLERGDYVWLGRLGTPERGRGLRLQIAECGCGNTCTLTVRDTRRLRRGRGVARLRLGRDARRTIGRLALRLALERPTAPRHSAPWAAQRGV